MPSTEYDLPRFPFGGPAATIVRWLKQPGDSVAAGEPLAIVVNDRVELAIPAPVAGVLEAHLFGEGAELLVGAPLATIASTVAATSATTPAAPAQRSAPRLRSTPVARRMAAALGLDLESLSRCGVDRRVTKADILAALAPAPGAEPPAPALAASSAAPAGVAPAALQLGAETHALSAIEIDMGRVVEARLLLSADFLRRGLALTDATFVIWAALSALLRHPLLNGAWNDSGMIIRRRVNLAVRSAGRQALVCDAQDLNLRGLARAIDTAPPVMDGDATFTIVVAGEGAWLGMPALFARQGATLGVGAARLRPLVVAEHGLERVAVRAALMLTLAYDARMLDQGHADAFLRDIKTRLERLTLAAHGY